MAVVSTATLSAVFLLVHPALAWSSYLPGARVGSSAKFTACFNGSTSKFNCSEFSGDRAYFRIDKISGVERAHMLNVSTVSVSE
ncbi:hypothetical protein [Streptomyces gobiensis]|uniref:hypothetical protein n=1 Tax=Streptomyces gobiensis TaxID=2875706 RepID=UPI001E3862A5|nr:hypothetical protein [Streptomyces gobiensis]UGY92832.1 hypothetical protein test1122_14725 [Streptomyces gobiensis]